MKKAKKKKKLPLTTGFNERSSQSSLYDFFFVLQNDNELIDNDNAGQSAAAQAVVLTLFSYLNSFLTPSSVFFSLDVHLFCSVPWSIMSFIVHLIIMLQRLVFLYLSFLPTIFIITSIFWLFIVIFIMIWIYIMIIIIMLLLLFLYYTFEKNLSLCFCIVCFILHYKFYIYVLMFTL